MLFISLLISAPYRGQETCPNKPLSGPAANLLGTTWAYLHFWGATPALVQYSEPVLKEQFLSVKDSRSNFKPTPKLYVIQT